jgi:hypothetical protein
VNTPSSALLEAMKTLDARLIRRGDDVTGIPYLWRAYLGEKTKNQDVGIFLHRFVSSDALEYHCHPWVWARAFILEGSYIEDRVLALDVDLDAKVARLDGSTRRTKTFGPGSQNVIFANTFHRVDLLTPEVWTLFIHGPRVGNWGFVGMNTFAEPVPMRLMKGHTRDRLSKEIVK